MNKSNLKEWWNKYNILSRYHRKKMRKQLKNREISFLCPNCIGGLLLHDLGLPFNSPTINLMMYQKDFVKFVMNLEDYLAKELVFYRDEEFECPCAMLEDISIHFTHYSSEIEAKEKWEVRKRRINKDNLFVFLQERDGLCREDICRLSQLRVRGLLVLTANEYFDIPYTLQIPKYKKKGEVGNILRKNWLNNRREYEKYVDFVKWFNESEGFNYDISPFSKLK